MKVMVRLNAESSNRTSLKAGGGVAKQNFKDKN